MSAESNVKPLPRLDAFDEEFGREEADIAGESLPRSRFRLLPFTLLALAAGLITALALGWSNLSGTPPEAGPGASSSQASAESEATINRLRREVEALQKENKELQEAQQQAANAALQADERG